MWNSHKELFNGRELRSYTSQIYEDIKNEVSSIKDETISTCDLDEWAAYLVEKHSITPLTLYEDAIQQSLTETKVKKYNPFSKINPFEPEYYDIDGYSIGFSIPFDGDQNILFLSPSQRILTSFPISSFTPPVQDDLGQFTLTFSYPKKELLDRGAQMKEYVDNKFESEFSSYRKMVSYANLEASSFNQSLPNRIKSLLVARKEKATSLTQVSQLLAIPLSKSPSAPNSVPIPLKHIIRTPPRKPSAKPAPPEYAIRDEDYKNINNIILMEGKSMETLAKTFIKNDEEELRDFLLVTLNTHYENATGETFRKTGKTDINIVFENKAAFIGECKIWRGEKYFADAIKQLVGYSTWRDVKTSVIVFNKENQSFKNVLDKIDLWLSQNAINSRRVDTNMWTCQYKLTDADDPVTLSILVFDLYVHK